MWEFVKSNPLTVTAGLIIFVGAIVGVIVGVVLRGRAVDSAFMRTSGGKSIKWRKSSLPLAVFYTADISIEWLDAWAKATAELTKSIGTDVFIGPVRSSPGLKPGELLDSVILQDDNGLDPGHAVTSLSWRKFDGATLSAMVTFPEALEGKLEETEAVALHEACHVLGLAHDLDDKNSIMHPVLQKRPQKLTDADQKLLRKVYG